MDKTERNIRSYIQNYFLVSSAVLFNLSAFLRNFTWLGDLNSEQWTMQEIRMRAWEKRIAK